MKLSDRVLERVYDLGEEFVWLDELARTVGADRASLEEALRELRERGHTFELSPVRGIRLVRPTVLDAHLIKRNLPVAQIGREVVCLDEVSSTSDVAFNAAVHCHGQALVVTAEFQHAGRGRFGRKWICPHGAGILASVLLFDPRGRLPHEVLTIGAGLAIAEGIEKSTGVQASLEWPNDLVLDGAKLAGVLVEVRGLGGARHVVVGFGINVYTAPPARHIGRKTTFLAEATGAQGTPERVEVLRGVLVALDRWVMAIQAGCVDALRDRWRQRCHMVNRRLTFDSARGRVTGRVLDIDPFEGLIVVSDGGQRFCLPAATSSIAR